jgi:hypothetical protein
MFEESEVATLDRIFGTAWHSMTVAELREALKDDMAADAAEFEQFVAENRERRRFTEAVIAAMHERGAEFCTEVYDDVARELYGGHTAQTRRWIAEVEAFAAEGPS